MDGFQRDLGMHFRAAGAGAATIRFDRVELAMLAHAGVNDYSTTVTLRMDDDYAATFELDDARFAELLSLVSARLARDLRLRLDGPDQPCVVELEDLTIPVGFRTQLGEPREVEAEVFIPFVVTGVFRAKRVVAIEVETAPAPRS